MPGNRVELLKDATQNCPAWLDAIEAARHSIHFESHIIHDDATGREFAHALRTSGAGVQVRVLYDWLGVLGKSSRRLGRDLRAAGVEVRSFNPPAWSSPFAWLSRDHRKMLAVEGAGWAGALARHRARGARPCDEGARGRLCPHVGPGRPPA